MTGAHRQPRGQMNRSGAGPPDPPPTTTPTHPPKRKSFLKPPAFFPAKAKPARAGYRFVSLSASPLVLFSSARRARMWVFYVISLPLTVGMVAATLRYFAGPAVPARVLAVVGYAWLCSLSFVVLVPTDIWMVRSRRLLAPCSPPPPRHAASSSTPSRARPLQVACC
jgi:hypothetical protein